MSRGARWSTIGAVAVLSMGLTVPQCGGLKRADFELVNVPGFDKADDQVDHNDYAYSMAYFRADGAEEGHVYVGTGNNISNLIGYYITTLIEGGDLLDAPVRPPEIRRYRPDLGPTEWEVVFDYRDIESEPDFKTFGFRFMDQFEAADAEGSPQRSNYLYAATQGEQSFLWRSKTGNRGDWEQVFAYEELGGSIRWATQLDGRIYLAVAFDSFGATPPPGEIWVSEDGLSFRPIMQDGFGNPDNRGVQALIPYRGWIYAGTKNDVEGFEIWKLRPQPGHPDAYEYVRVVAGGGPSAHNENAGMPIEFQGALYWGTQLYVGGVNPTSGNAFQGCDIIRINPDDSWDTIVGPNSLSGYESGFNHFTNAYLWWMEEHNGWLYAGTFDQGTLLSWLLDNLDSVLAYFDQADKDGRSTFLRILDQLLDVEDYYRLTHAGADLFKSPNGVDWYPVTLDGFENPRNYGWRTMVSAPDGYLYLGSANPSEGAQVWRGKRGLH